MKEYKIKLNGSEYTVEIKDFEDNNATVSVNGQEFQVELEGLATKPKTPKVVQKATVPSTDSHPSVAKTSAPTSGRAIKSPLPGVLLDVVVKEGDTVKVGQKLMVLEAMKMENNIESDADGIVKSVAVRKGDSVLEGDVLITIG